MIKTTRIPKQEYIDMYCWNSQITQEVFDQTWVAMMCDCGDVRCRGWAVVSKDPKAMNLHRQLYVRSTGDL